ncbi:hypothetical protein KIW84_013390, partial [Lathyrus oleraceus]
WLETMDGSIQRVDVSIITYSPIIYDEVVVNHKGTSRDCAISLPDCVTTKILGHILDYFQFIHIKGCPNKERTSFDEIMAHADKMTLRDLEIAAEKLQFKHLLYLTRKSLAGHFKGKTHDDIRETLYIQDYLTKDDEFGEKLYEEPSIDDILSFINDTSEEKGMSKKNKKKKN